LDVNDDGKIDMKDIGSVAFAFGTNGQNISKASRNYTSDWIDITDKCGQNITITHDLNSTDLIVDIQGKASLSSGPHQRNYGLTGYMQGWNKTYGGTDYDYARALVQTADGGYALAGYTGDFWLVKTNAAGNMMWNQTYGGTSGDYAWALVQTADGGYALAGGTDSFGAGGHDFWLVRTDADGTMMWNRTYGGTDVDGAYALLQTADGGYALAGRTNSFGAGNEDFWLVKTDAAGTMQWNQTYGGTDVDVAYALVQTADGGYALAGYTKSLGAGKGDFWLVKADAAGNMMWNQTYGGTDVDGAYALVQTGDGGYALAGYTGSFGAGAWEDFWLVKTDSAGNMQWSKTYGGALTDIANALVQTADGGYALAGYTGFLEGFETDFWLVKTDAAGTMQWNQTYGGTDVDVAYALLQTADGGYALAGSTWSFGAGYFDFWLVKTDASGNVGGVESGLAWIDSSANTITLYRGATDTYWNFVRVRLWKPR